MDYTLTNEELKKVLRQINGLYIPGDSQHLVKGGNYHFVKTVKDILMWAQDHNEQDTQHFPIMGVGYGFLAMLRSQMDYPKKYLQHCKAGGKLQLNLAHEPRHTYIYDEYNKNELETMLDKIKFFSDLELGITMEDFVRQEHHLSKLFVPVGSFHDEEKASSNEELVAVVEGVVYPWFGVGYRIDRIQYSME